MTAYYNIKCNSCSNINKLDIDFLEIKLPMYSPITLKNINEIVYKFICFKCKVKNFILTDDKEQHIFDMGNLVLCTSCALPIPIPRLNITPTKLCVTCVEEGELINKENNRLGVILPDVVPKPCPRCKKGIQIARYSKENDSFFKGCSEYDKKYVKGEKCCYWTEEIDE